MDKNNKISDNDLPGNKTNPFIVPDNYFENLSGKLTERINNTEKAGKKINLYTKSQPYIVAAAALIILFFAIWILLFAKSGVNTYNKGMELVLDTTAIDNEIIAYQVDEDYMINYLQSEAELSGTDSTEYKNSVADYLEYENIDLDN